MADPTQMPPEGAPTAAAPSAAPSADDSGSGGFVVCIAAQDDGTFQVYAQDDDSDPTAQGASPDDSGATQTADNVDDALALAKQMIEQEAGEGEADDSGDGNAPMDQGSAQKVWDQMAAKKDKARMAGE